MADSRTVYVNGRNGASTNGKTTVVKDGPPTGEIGSGWDRDARLFGYYENGKIFETGPIEVADYQSMLRLDGKARSLEEVLTLPLRTLDFTIKGQKGDKGERDFIEEALTTPASAGGMTNSFKLVIAQMTEACVFRRSYHERVYKVRDDGKVVYDRLAYRPPTTCYLARDANNGDFAGFQQWTWIDQSFQKVTIPPERAFVYLHGANRDPMKGKSDLEVAYALYQTKQKIRFLWAVFLETQVLPKMVAKYHQSGATDQANEWADSAATLAAGGTIGADADKDLIPLPSGTHAAQAFIDALTYLDREMLDSCLAGFLGLAGAASEGRGSFALSADQSQFFLQNRDAVAGEMGEHITSGSSAAQAGLIQDLCQWNFPDPKVPQIEFESLLKSEKGDRTIALLTALLTAPNSKAPQEFINLLIEKGGEQLDLDPDKVAKAIAEGPPPPVPGPAGHIAQATDVVHGMVTGQGADGGSGAAVQQSLAPGF